MATPPPRARGRPSQRAPHSIPRFTLYGEAAAPDVDLLHVEEIRSRSSLYRWEIDAHVHAGHHQLLWLRRGEVQLRLDESDSHLQAPGALAIPPGVVHAFRFLPGTDGHVLTLHPRALVEGEPALTPEALQALFGRPRVLALDFGSDAASRLDALFTQLQREAAQADASPVPLWLARSVAWRLAQVAARLARADEQAAGAARQAALHTRFLALVESHYLEHWPVARYAQRLGTSTDRLNRVTRAHAGRSALALIHDRLLREACRRLTYLAAPVASLGFELGFDDPAYFSRFFKRGTGVSPGVFRTRSRPVTDPSPTAAA